MLGAQTVFLSFILNRQQMQDVQTCVVASVELHPEANRSGMLRMWQETDFVCHNHWRQDVFLADVRVVVSVEYLLRMYFPIY